VIGDLLAGHLGYVSIRTAEDAASSWVGMRRDLQDEVDVVHDVVLAYLVDSTPGVVCGAAALPDWVITTDLHFSILDRRARGRLRADAALVRASSVGVLGQVSVVDESEADRAIATGSVNHARVPLTSSLDVPRMPVGVRFTSSATPQSVDQPISELLEFQRIDGGSDLRFRPRPLGVNPLGIVHGSVSTALAMRVARAYAGPGWKITDVMSRYCGSIRQGPAVARGRLLSRTTSECLVQVDVRDEAHAAHPANLSWIKLRPGLPGEH
jgi:acyl-coenzyme A thioesterase PaaI-like protein